METSGNEIIVNECKVEDNENSQNELKNNLGLNDQDKERGIRSDKLATGFPSSMGINNYYKSVLELANESKEKMNHLNNIITEFRKDFDALNSSYKNEIELTEKITDSPVKSWNQKTKLFLVEQQEQNFSFHREVAFLNKELTALGNDVEKCNFKVSSIEKRVAT